MKCQASRCPREATMGSRCTKHWLKRIKAGKRLYKYKMWRRYHAKAFVQGLDVRRMVGYTGPVLMTFTPRFHDKWHRLISEIILAFDKETKHDDSDGGAQA